MKQVVRVGVIHILIHNIIAKIRHGKLSLHLIKNNIYSSIYITKSKEVVLEGTEKGGIGEVSDGSSVSMRHTQPKLTSNCFLKNIISFRDHSCWHAVKIFIKSNLKSLVILAMWLALSGAIYSRIALSFALNCIFFSANENGTVEQYNHFKAF